MMPPEAEYVAFHEAGHAVIAYRVREIIRDPGISIVPTEDLLGIAHIKGDDPWLIQCLRQHSGFPRIALKAFRRKAERNALHLLGGPLAELRFLSGRSPSGIWGYTGASEDEAMFTDDFQRYCALLNALTNGRDQGNGLYSLRLNDRVRRMLREPRTWLTVRTLAGRLMNRGTVSADEVEAIFRSAGVPQISKREWIGATITARSIAETRSLNKSGPKDEIGCGPLEGSEEETDEGRKKMMKEFDTAFFGTRRAHGPVEGHNDAIHCRLDLSDVVFRAGGLLAGSLGRVPCRGRGNPRPPDRGRDLAGRSLCPRWARDLTQKPELPTRGGGL
jgi:hypothetical protein